MIRPKGFEKSKERNLRTLDFCECRFYPGRTHCFNCTIDKGYEEQSPRFNPTTFFPSWWKNYQDTVLLSNADRDFLAGRKLYQPRKRTYSYKKAW
jgi:hypothetical protein